MLERAVASVATPRLPARLARLALWRFGHVRVAQSSELAGHAALELHGAPYTGEVLVFSGSAHQDVDSLFSLKVTEAFEALGPSDSPSFRDGVLAFATSYGSLRAKSADVLRQEYLEPLGLWGDLVDYLREMGVHLQVADLYIRSNGDHEYARRYFQQRVESGLFASAPEWWALPVGRFVLNRLPHPNHLDAFIRHVPTLLAESVNVYASEYMRDGFRIKVDPARRELRYEATCLEAGLILQVVRALFLPRHRGLERVCEECGDLFMAGRKDRRYCSLRCRVAHHRNINGLVPARHDTRSSMRRRAGRAVDPSLTGSRDV
jgi:hypothetical protein